jgi:hypothetical protein
VWGFWKEKNFLGWWGADMINLDRRYLAAAMALVLVLAFWGGIKYNQIKDRPADDAELLTPIENDNPGQKSTEQVIQVYVTRRG